jgi:hypothetical protein
MSRSEPCRPIRETPGRSLMRCTALAVAAAGVVLVAAASPVSAIGSENSSPAPERTEVGGLAVAVDFNGDGEFDLVAGTCSGTMVDADTFLTAAHCTDNFPPGTRFLVTLQEDAASLLAALAGLPVDEQIDRLLANGWAVEGDAHRDPAFPGSQSDRHDIAVIDFAERDTNPADVWSFTPATLPTAGMLDELGSRALDSYDWWVVGYGVQQAERGPGGHTHPGGGVRLKAPLDFNALNNTWVRLAQNASRDLGGACYGDSGGPNYVDVDGTLVLAATTSTGDVPCYATNVVYRTDTPQARAFLDDFVELP